MAYKLKGDIAVERGTYLGLFTTAERTAFTPSQSGAIVYDTTLNQFFGWDGSNWTSVGSSAYSIEAISASGAITEWNSIVEADATGGAIALTLPTIDANSTGKFIWVKKLDASTNAVTVVLTQETVTLSTQNDAVAIFNDGTDSYVGANISGEDFSAWLYDGNTVGSQKTIGTIDAFDLPIITTNTTRFTVDATSATLTSTGNATFTTDTGSNMSITSLDTGSVSLNSGTTGSVLVGTTGAKTVQVGNTTGATALNLAVGTGGFILDGVASTNYDIAASQVTGTINIGGTASANAIIIGRSTVAEFVNIGNGTGATNILLGQNGQSVIKLGTSTNAQATTVTIGNTNNGTGVTINVGLANFVLNGQATSTYTIGAATTTGTITVGGTAQTTPLALRTGQPVAPAVLADSTLNTTSLAGTQHKFLTQSAPETVLVGNLGDTATDLTRGSQYIKLADAGANTGWASAESYKVKTVTANYTLDNSDSVIYADSSGGSFTITIPATFPQGKRMYIASEGTANTVTVQLSGGTIIDPVTNAAGATSVIPTSLGLYSSIVWYVVGTIAIVT